MKEEYYYIAWPPDNGTYMWADFRRTGTPPPGILCEVCGQRINFDLVNPNYTPPRSYYDLSSCYDGDYLVSPRLRDFLIGSGLLGLHFGTIPKSCRYLVLRCSNVLTYVRGPGVHEEEYCERCRTYRSVWGSGPKGDRFEGIDEPIEVGIYISNMHFGYYPQKGPLLVVGRNTWKEMVKQGFKGLSNGKPVLSD
jgi:hypothetical protein